MLLGAAHGRAALAARHRPPPRPHHLRQRRACIPKRRLRLGSCPLGAGGGDRRAVLLACVLRRHQGAPECSHPGQTSRHEEARLIDRQRRRCCACRRRQLECLECHCAVNAQCLDAELELLGRLDSNRCTEAQAAVCAAHPRRRSAHPLARRAPARSTERLRDERTHLSGEIEAAQCLASDRNVMARLMRNWRWVRTEPEDEPRRIARLDEH